MTDKNATGPAIVDDAALEDVRGGARVATVKFGIQTTALHGDDDDRDADKPVAQVFDYAWDVEANPPS